MVVIDGTVLPSCLSCNLFHVKCVPRVICLVTDMSQLRIPAEMNGLGFLFQKGDDHSHIRPFLLFLNLNAPFISFAYEVIRKTFYEKGF